MSLEKENLNVGVIGVGVMGEALLSALISAGQSNAKISIFEKREDRASEITSKYGVKKSELKELCGSNDVLLLVTKPQDLGSLLEEISSSVKTGTLLISFAAGKKIEFISSKVTQAKVVRVMPNTPMLVGEGMSAISLGEGISEDLKRFVLNFLNASGKAIIVDESLQDAVTATSGSGPAYFFAFVEEMIKGATSLGLSESDATTLTIQTIVGAAKMLEESGKTPTTLRENVTSPNGTTAAALAKFSEGKLGNLIAESMKAARDRSQELA
jgi:pyrroline-5-carboxylate reductase